MSTYFIAGARNYPGTQIPNNVTGDCGHKHRSPEAAQKCIEAVDASIKRGHGRSAFCDRSVIKVVDGVKLRTEDGDLS